MGSSDFAAAARPVNSLSDARCTRYWLKPLRDSRGLSCIPAAAALAIILLAGCADKPLVVVADAPLCTITSRPAITEAQRAAFRADQALWEPLVDWLAGFLKVRDGACLKPAAG